MPEEINIYFNNKDPGETDSSEISKIQQISVTSEEKSVRVLGILLDKKLKLPSHINSICSKVSRSIYCLSQVKNLLDMSCLKLIYSAHIQSHLNYCRNIFSLLSFTIISFQDLIQVNTLCFMYEYWLNRLLSFFNISWILNR